MVDETEFLNSEDDKYADKTVEICDKCNLPKTVVTYELGLQLLRKQLYELREDLQRMVNRIDTLGHN